MPGMVTGLNENDPTIVSAIHAALLRQLLVVLLILAFSWICRTMPVSVAVATPLADESTSGTFGLPLANRATCAAGIAAQAKPS
jgi:hypothetical protein